MIVRFIGELKKYKLLGFKTSLLFLNGFELWRFGESSGNRCFWKLIEYDLYKLIYSIALIRFFGLHFCNRLVFGVLYVDAGEPKTQIRVW